MKDFIQIDKKYIFNPSKTKVYEIITPFVFYNRFEKTSVIQIYNKNFQKELKYNISEFILLARATKIHSISYSGYFIVTSWIYSREYVKYD